MENQSMKIVLTSTKKGKMGTFGIEMNGEIFLELDPKMTSAFLIIFVVTIESEKRLKRYTTIGRILPEVAILILC